ncbi:hypothetical protein N7481_010462 [Penicillium waksmanii]|uniref:uncharacterized protein n=1 Tax=Penicillium waksmanii TaxID=69791 RepID=UPI0025488531|nr:uncharacterized protein N7481_010462 [Penicillium waksmanii]KAJ5973252.1 hypothetical protein N7481_010462 [Penicillium waksmanii]
MSSSVIFDGQNQGPIILAVCWVLVLVPGLVLALRIWCKTALSRGLGWDDLVVGLAWVLQLVYTVLITKAVQLGVIGKHVEAIEDPSIIPPALKLVYISFVIVIIGCVLSKTSFAITLLRIVTQVWMKVFLWFIIITMNSIMWLCAVCYLAQCKPAAALWNTKLMATAQCWPTSIFENIALTAGAYSGCMDFILALLPWAVIWNLQMKKREKFGIAVAMSLGVFAAATAFVKTSKLVNISQVQDFTYYCSSIIIWASAETGLTIFAASIPALRILLVRMRSTFDRTDDPVSGIYSITAKNRGKNRDTPSTDRYHYFAGEPITLLDRGDNSSEKSILAKTGGIKQTQEISVSYERNIYEEHNEMRMGAVSPGRTL